MALHFPHVSLLPLERYATLLDPERMQRVALRIAELRGRLAGRVVWNISSTAVGGGVAEMVRSLLAYARGVGVDARWVVIEGSPEFFRVTKRLHHAIHGSVGDASPLEEAERRLYERVVAQNAAELAPMVRPHDVVIVHDPQPAGMVAPLARRGAQVIWRCHIGPDQMGSEVERAWRFLARYLDEAAAYVFSRAAYLPEQLDASRATIISPSIDPFSPKNQPLSPSCIRAILAQAELVDGVRPQPCLFLREDGTPGRVDRRAEMVRLDGPPRVEVPLVVQVSRWDPLKDPLGVLRGFAAVEPAALGGAHLVLAGPNVRAVADDPEGASVFDEVVAAWRALPTETRARVHLAMLPMVDVDENGVIVNALQRHAAVVVQKSLHEGFGLTVTEAMWKARPVVASAVGGICDQVEDGIDGLLLADPRDPALFGAALKRLFADPKLARRLGERAHVKVRDHFLGLDSLLRYGALIEQLDSGGATELLSSPPI